MGVTFHRQFITDLVASGDAVLPGRVLKKVLTTDGEFRSDRGDHAYRGIPNAYIRVVSRGTTAYRVIYIRNGNNVLLYRAGPHSVEDNLAPPQGMEGHPLVSDIVVEAAMRPIGATVDAQRLYAVRSTVEEAEASRYLKNHERRRLYENLVGRRLIPHKEAYLISPYISHEMLRTTSAFGQMLDEWIGSGCEVTLISRPPTDDIEKFNRLEARGFKIMYVQKLHAKAYVFKVAREKLNQWQQSKKDLAVLGSANLTTPGFHPEGERNRDPQLELSYQVHDGDINELDDFISFLASVGTSHNVLRHRITDIGGAH